MRYTILIAAVLAIASILFVAINIFDPFPSSRSGTLIAAPSDGVADHSMLQESAVCNAIQDRIDAVGRPGWNSLDEALKADIDSATGCIFIGDEQGF